MKKGELFEVKPWMCCATIAILLIILNFFPAKYALLKIFGKGADRTAMNVVLGGALAYVALVAGERRLRARH